MTQTMHLKLINGEEIIGIVDGAEEGYIVLKNIRSLVVQQVGERQMGIGMVPYMMGNPDATIKIPTNAIMGDPTTSPPKNLEDNYLQQVTGLTFATSGGNGQIKI